MAVQKWLLEDTVTEVELERQAKLGTIQNVTIEMTKTGYQVIVRLAWHPKPVALRTRRELTQPRRFQSLERLVAFIQDRLPSIKEVSLKLRS